MPFSALSEAKWLADYYAAVAFLCAKLGKSLRDYLGDASDYAEALIVARNSSRRAEVKKRITAQTTVFEAKPSKEQAEAVRRAELLTRFRPGRTTACPSCESPALLGGDEIKRSEPSYSQGELIVTVTYATTELRCVACGLHLRTVDECTAGGAPPRFQQYEGISLHDIHQDQEQEEFDNM